MAITTPCGLHGKTFKDRGRKWTVHSFSWNDAKYICEAPGGWVRYYTPDEILMILLREGTQNEATN